MTLEVPALEFRQVGYRYPLSETWALQAINLKIPQGAFCVIAGPTGCGKSTLLHLVRGLLFEYGGQLQGEIFALGEPVQPGRIPELGRRIGIVFQDPARQLHQLRVIDELRSGPVYQGLAWEECVRRALEAAHELVPPELFSRSPTELSGGQQQRVALAAALAMQVDIVVLDEPLSYLDGVARDDFLTALESLKKKGKTIVVTSHDLEDLLDLADLLVVLSAGRIALSGPVNKVLYSDILREVVGVPLFVEIGERLRSERALPTEPRSWRELAKLLPETNSTQTMPSASAKSALGYLTIDNVRYSYPDGRVALDGLSLKVSQGEIVGLVGPNGAGKSTVARSVLGLLRPKSGRIWLGDLALSTIPVAHVARHVGYVTQNPAEMIFETTVFRECLFGPKSLRLEKPEEKVDQTLSRLGLSAYRDSHPRSLSIGQQRLLTLADILVNDPQVLLLDEPEFGLDPLTWCHVSQIIRQLAAAGKTVLILTHSLQASLFLCESIAIVNGGRIKGRGSPWDILLSPHLLEVAGLGTSRLASFLQRLGIRDFQPQSQQEFVESVVIAMKKRTAA